VSSRRDQKERLRQERLAREQAAAAVARRKRLLGIAVAAATLVALGAVVAVVSIAAGGGSSTSGAQAGVQATPAPWQPEYGSLQKRVAALGLPQAADYPFHIHAMLRIYVDGKQVEVPSQIGIDAGNGFIAPLHTHDASGVIHLEAVKAYPFTLGQFFDVWGVKFGDRQIGAYRDDGTKTVQVYVNGRRISDPVGYVLKKHDRIVVAYGNPGSFPKRFSTPFPAGL
jgi:hypothetical protein